MVATDPEGLAQTINEGIAIRGIDALIDERLDLLCGPGTIRRINSPDITPLIKRLCDWARLVSHSVPNWIRLLASGLAARQPDDSRVTADPA